MSICERINIEVTEVESDLFEVAEEMRERFFNELWSERKEELDKQEMEMNDNEKCANYYF